MLYIITDTDLTDYAKEMSDAFQLDIKCMPPNEFELDSVGTDDIVVNFFNEEPINLDLEQFGGYYPEQLKYVAITPICESMVHKGFSEAEVADVQEELNKIIASEDYVMSLLELHRRLQKPILLIKYAITHSNKLNYIGDLCNVYNKFVLYDNLGKLRGQGSVDLSSDVLRNVIQLSEYVPRLYNLDKSKIFKE